MDDQPTQTNGRSRSCTDPGQSFKSLSRLQQPLYNQFSFSEDRTSGEQLVQTPPMHNKLQKSGIPRPTNRKRAQTIQSEVITEDSDIELRYETENRDRRRLTVANAEVYPSSSSTSGFTSGAESIHGGPSKFHDTPKQYSSLRRESKWSQKGLGLALYSQKDPPEREKTQSGTSSSNKSNNLKVESVARSSPLGSPCNSFALENARRRAALVRLVSKLELEQPPLTERHDQTGVDGSDCIGEEGVALPGSSLAFAKSSSLPTKDDDEASQYEDDYEEDDRYRLLDKNQSVEPVVQGADSQFNTYNASFSRQPQKIKLQGWAAHAPSENTPGIISSSVRSNLPRKSPVIRQSVPEGSPALLSPAALKRRSIYIETPDPSLAGDSTPKVDEAPPREASIDTETASIISGTADAIAARARRAFGIPQSDSDRLYDNADLRLHRASLAESEFSSAGSTFWRAAREGDHSGGGSELSVGAASLFRNLSDGGKGQQEHEARLRAPSVCNTPVQHYAETPVGTTSSSPLASSAYEGGIRSAQQTDDSDDQLIDPMETNRQKIIREFCESEETFVARMHLCVQLFILPLRMRDSKTWVEGVPPDLTHFLDWFEDIANLHTWYIVHTLRDIQRAATHTQMGVIRCISEPLLVLIPKLEIYQPYLVRLGSVASTLGQIVREDGNDFGEFVTIQQRTPECGGWGLEAFLLEPMNRLIKYCDIFSRLLSCTPKDHPDYLPTFSVLQSIDAIVRVMTEVKLREDEYDLLKDLVNTIRGLPSGLQLATRERRLLCQAQLYLLGEDDKDAPLDGAQKAGNQDATTQVKPPFKEKSGNRMSRLASAVQAWDSLRGRTGSIKSTTSSCAGFSIHSDVSQNFSKAGHDTEYVLPHEATTTSGARKPIQLFILSDMAILAKSIPEEPGSKLILQLVNGIGLSQVFHAELEADRRDGY
ncbi:hypothetical protein AX15_007379 [Amanita polypyramis BW_CC]|nr:hypothetical protein AX15_007379 [Amanita polypyramis BW_CC]